MTDHGLPTINNYPAMPPVVMHRASICTWNLEFRFYTYQQCLKFITRCFEEQLDINFRYDLELAERPSEPDEHWIRIESIPWATNLATIAEILQECDHMETPNASDV